MLASYQRKWPFTLGKASCGLLLPKRTEIVSLFTSFQRINSFQKEGRKPLTSIKHLHFLIFKWPRANNAVNDFRDLVIAPPFDKPKRYFPLWSSQGQTSVVNKGRSASLPPGTGRVWWWRWREGGWGGRISSVIQAETLGNSICALNGLAP